MMYAGALFLSVLENRRRSLLQDGYKVMFEHKDDIGYFCKLRHQNGSIVSLNATYADETIRQTTDGKTVHVETVRKP